MLNYDTTSDFTEIILGLLNRGDIGKLCCARCTSIVNLVLPLLGMMTTDIRLVNK
jgi:hypothetical protein